MFHFINITTYRIIKKLILILTFLYILSNCAALKPGDSKGAPLNSQERARKNVNEGRGVSIGNILGQKNTNYEFSTSNPLWRASLEIVDFLPLTVVDYSGGIIITDWYNDGIDVEESIKITLRFLSTEIRSDSVKIIIHKKKCRVSENCKIDEIDSKIKFELQKSILAKASQFEANKNK